MNRFISLLLLALIIFSGCKQHGTQKAGQPADTTQQNNDTAAPQALTLSNALQDSLQKLLSMTGPNKYIEQTARQLFLLGQDSNLTADRIWQKILLRDSLVNMLNGIQDSIGLDGGLIEPMLKPYGIALRSSEGGFSFFIRTKLLTPREREICKPCALVDDFLTYQEANYGREYIYSDTQTLIKQAQAGLTLYKNYPDTKYYRYIEQQLHSLIHTIADIHRYNSMCYSGDLTIDEFETIDCDIYSRFIKALPGCKISSAFEKILQDTMSYITVENPGSYEPFFTVFAVVIDEQPYPQAVKTIFNYLTQGIDIPHLLSVSDTGTVLIAYRFYPDSALAARHLQKIRPDYPGAKLCKLVFEDYNVTVAATYK